MPRTQDLDMHLRRRFIEQTQAQRPRLRQNLRQLGAVGPVTRPLAAHSQQAVVKVGVTKATTTGKHLRYLSHGTGLDGQDAALFGPGSADRQAFTQAAQHDPHQFRLVVSVPDHPRLNRTQYIDLFMAQVERDLGRPLEWVAAHHYNTDHAHTHIVVRGRDRDGKDLYMAKHYLTQGLRDRASHLLTQLLGPMRHQQQVEAHGRALILDTAGPVTVAPRTQAQETPPEVGRHAREDPQERPPAGPRMLGEHLHRPGPSLGRHDSEMGAERSPERNESFVARVQALRQRAQALPPLRQTTHHQDRGMER